MAHKGKVYLIGAGPGDESLFTIRGGQILERADVVLYDRLVNSEILHRVPGGCECILVGKRKGKHSYSQEEINKLLVQKACEGKRTVRLKGGDSFVFGRGGEEIEALEHEGIPYEVVPGITSAIAALETAGIPVTHRGVARSFHIITGYTADGNIKDQFSEYASLKGTLIFLMGVHHLKEIADNLLANGKAGDTPVSLVENGTTFDQRRTDAVLEDVAKVAVKRNVKPPAIFVVGDVARLHMFSKSQPLTDCAIGVTGTEAIVDKSIKIFKDAGARVLGAPFIAVESTGRLSAEHIDWNDVDWMVFTSANGVEKFFNDQRKCKVDIRKYANAKYAVIGEGTADALAEYGIYPDYMPDTYSIKELAVGLTRCVGHNEHIYLFRAEDGSRQINNILESNGNTFFDIGIYRTVEKTDILLEFVEKIYDLDYVTFASASGVRRFMDLWNRKFGEKSLPDDIKVVCIGNKTAEILEDYGVENVLVADKYTVEGMLDCIERDRCKYEK